MVQTSDDWSAGPLSQPYVKRSRYLADALKSLSAPQDNIRSPWELMAKLGAVALTGYADKKNDAKLKEARKQDLDSETATMVKLLGGSFGGGGATGSFETPPPEPEMFAAPKSTPVSQSALPDIKSAPSIAPREKDLLARILIGEAGNQSDQGQQAVAAVIANRAKQSGKSIGEVITAPGQFEPFGNQKKWAQLQTIPPQSPQYQRALQNAELALSGRAELPPEVATADHFYSPSAQSALGRQTPSWDNGKGADLGDHRFFALGYGGQPPIQPQRPPLGAIDPNMAMTGGINPDAPQPQMQLPTGAPQLSMPQLAQPQGVQPYQVASTGPTPPPPQGQQNPRGPTQQELAMYQAWMSSGQQDKVEAARALAQKIQARMAAPTEYDIKEVNGVPTYYDKNNPSAAPRVGQLPQGVQNRTVSGAEAGIPNAPPGARFTVSPTGEVRQVYAPPEGMQEGPGGRLEVRPGMGTRPLTDPQERARYGIQPTDRNAYVVDAKGNISKGAENPYGADRLQAIRQDVEKSPEVVAWSVVAPVWGSMKDAFGRKTRAADLNLVYGMAKLMDPGSVVREGEQVLVNNTNSLPDWLQGQINRLNGGAALQDDTRQALMAEAGSRVAQVYQNAQPKLQYYKEFAQRNGFDARDIIPSLPAYEPWAPPATKRDGQQSLSHDGGGPADRGVGGGGNRPVPGGPPVKAPDGNFYVADPNRSGKYLKVVP